MNRKQFIVFYLVLITMTIGLAGHTREVGGVSIPESMNAGGQKMILNGAGVREKFFIDIYAVGLYLKNKKGNAKQILNADEPMAIRMHIVSGLVTPKKMANNVNESFKRSTGGNIAPIKDRKDKMISVFRNGIKKGDVYDLIYIPGTGVKVSKNGKVKQTIPGLDFKKALFGIWIASPPLSKDLKKALLGK
ncbi:MAG: chalcone isomerase [Deltaproteobacteria bacterium]|nr:chalcone isomerase [Deltaproteobacteria bacterium]